MKSELWIDLEGTVIPHWNELDVHINMDMFDALVKQYTPQKIVVFSYAIWGKVNYNTLMLSSLYAILSKICPVEILTTDDMEDDCASLHQHMKEIPSRSIWYIPKEFSFIMSVRAAIERGSTSTTFVLFDDTAPHGQNYTVNDTQNIHYYNPKEMII